jgi:hypothetical protein
MLVHFTPTPFPKFYSSQYGPWTAGLHGLPRGMVVDPFPANTAPFGDGGCMGTSGLFPLISVRGNAAFRGQTFDIELKNGTNGLNSILFMGASNKLLLGVVPLPFGLNIIGMTGCQQLVSPDIVVPVPNNTQGSASVKVPIPNDPAFANVKLYSQFWTQDPGANTASLTASNGLEFTIQ